MQRSSALPSPVARRAAWRAAGVQRTRIPFWIWLGLLALGVAALLPVLQSSDVTARAAALRDLERERATLNAEVRLLASQVGELAGLKRVEKVARERLGLTPAQPTTVLSVPEPPPGRLLPARFFPVREQTVEMTLPWWQQVLDVLVIR